MPYSRLLLLLDEDVLVEMEGEEGIIRTFGEEDEKKEANGFHSVKPDKLITALQDKRGGS